jgi:hypothetical protein
MLGGLIVVANLGIMEWSCVHLEAFFFCSSTVEFRGKSA